MKIINKILKYTLLGFPVVLFVYAALLDYGIVPKQNQLQPIEIIADMAHQIIIQKQINSNFFYDSISTRIVPMEVFPLSDKYPYDMLEFMHADSLLKNPIIKSEYVLARGENLWQTHCISCHGKYGDGDGTVITQVELTDDEEGFPAPPDLKREESKALSDVRLFHILSAGQNLMFPIAYKISTIDRWILVLYVRELQIINGEIN